jgi:hypothetical protein
MNEPPPSESEEDDDEQDALDNIGNRVPDPSREPRHREAHVDDDIGNRFVPEDESANRIAEDIGNRGTYGEGHAAAQTKPRRPHGGKPFGFKKHGPRGDNDNRGNTIGPPQGHYARGPQGQGHGQGQGPGHGQGHGQGQGQPPGQGKKHRHRHKPKMHGQGQPPGQGQPQGQAPPQGQGAPHHAHGQGAPHHPGQPGQPGQGKRRRKHRNRHRGGNQTPPIATT